jgi:hypothetical protein
LITLTYLKLTYQSRQVAWCAILGIFVGALQSAAFRAKKKLTALWARPLWKTHVEIHVLQDMDFDMEKVAPFWTWIFRT